MVLILGMRLFLEFLPPVLIPLSSTRPLSLANYMRHPQPQGASLLLSLAVMFVMISSPPVLLLFLLPKLASFLLPPARALASLLIQILITVL